MAIANRKSEIEPTTNHQPLCLTCIYQINCPSYCCIPNDQLWCPQSGHRPPGHECQGAHGRCRFRRPLRPGNWSRVDLNHRREHKSLRSMINFSRISTRECGSGVTDLTVARLFRGASSTYWSKFLVRL